MYEEDPFRSLQTPHYKSRDLGDMDLSYLDRELEFKLRNEIDEGALLPRYLPKHWEHMRTKDRRGAEFYVCHGCGHATQPSISTNRCPSCGEFKLQRAILPLDQIATTTLTRLGLEYVSGKKTLRALEFVINCTIKNAHSKPREKGKPPYHAILSYSTIAKHAKCSRRQAIYIMHRLEEVGLVNKKVRATGLHGPHAIKNLCNIYSLGSVVWGAIRKHPLFLTSIGSYTRWRLSHKQRTLLYRKQKRLEKSGKEGKKQQQIHDLLFQDAHGGWPKAHPPPYKLLREACAF